MSQSGIPTITAPTAPTPPVVAGAEDTAINAHSARLDALETALAPIQAAYNAPDPDATAFTFADLVATYQAQLRLSAAVLQHYGVPVFLPPWPKSTPVPAGYALDANGQLIVAPAPPTPAPIPTAPATTA